MSTPAPEPLPFAGGDRQAVVERMARLAGDRSGWLVIHSEVDADDLERAPRTGGLFSGRGPAVPELSWVPGQPTRRRLPPISVGVRHASGPKAVDRLRSTGRPVPDGWDVVDDNPRRGLVARLPDGADEGEVLDWLLGAAEALTVVPLTGRWLAEVHRYV